MYKIKKTTEIPSVLFGGIHERLLPSIVMQVGKKYTNDLLRTKRNKRIPMFSDATRKILNLDVGLVLNAMVSGLRTTPIWLHYESHIHLF